MNSVRQIGITIPQRTQTIATRASIKVKARNPIPVVKEKEKILRAVKAKIQHPVMTRK